MDVDFTKISEKAENLANHILESKKLIHEILKKYESFDLINDEIKKTVDTLRNLSEIKNYFNGRTSLISSFLPLNLPLYSLVLFAIIPSYQAEKVAVRAPTALANLFEELFKRLELKKFLNNVYIFNGSRKDFIEEYCKKSKVIIFTGKYENFGKIRDMCSKETLMIFNGSGHNPVIITEDKDLKNTIKKIIHVKLYNNGQDCIAPNTIFVNSKILDKFMKILINQLRKIKVGPDYLSKKTKIGPLMDNNSVYNFVDIINNFLKNGAKMIYGGRVDFKYNLAHPTVFFSPINKFLNFQELYCPIFMINSYDNDKNLDLYFKDKDGNYSAKEMYVSLFGHSNYIENELKKSIILMNQTPEDVESGNKEFGGYSLQASAISYKGESIARPILIPREISEHLFNKN